MINVGEVGKDYEHGVQLLKKLGEFRGSVDGVSNQCYSLSYNYAAQQGSQYRGDAADASHKTQYEPDVYSFSSSIC